jgi:hypothetical protein
MFVLGKGERPPVGRTLSSVFNMGFDEETSFNQAS